jgi:sulfhydrogenase subunit beta (sulfur reductase)
MQVLPRVALEPFTDVLRRFGELHAPVSRGKECAFAPLARFADLRLDAVRTILPPKKYVLPPRETLFRYEPGRGFVAVSEGLDRRIVLLGVHACDVYGLNILDEVFAGPYPDPYFQARRRHLVVVGVDCTPDAHCFCRSMRADSVDRGFDLFLHDLGDRFLVRVGSALGDDVTIAAAELLRAVTPADVREYKRRSAAREEAFRLTVELRDLPEIFELEYESELWQELGERCLGCGSCSAVCPTCYCFDTADEPDLIAPDLVAPELATPELAAVGAQGVGARRVRSWDSCLFSTHALVAGGENFRHSRADRIKFRFYHKQRGFVAEYGRPSCVGCGRCTLACPAGIDIVGVLQRLRGSAA